MQNIYATGPITEELQMYTTLVAVHRLANRKASVADRRLLIICNVRL